MKRSARILDGFTRESRTIYLFKNGLENTKHLLKDEVWNTYLVSPYKKGDTIQMIGGPVMAFANTILAGPDAIYADAVDSRLESHNRFRIVRDTRMFFQNVMTLHPLRAAGDAFRVVFNDPILDGGDALFGFRHDRLGAQGSAMNVPSSQLAVRNDVAHTLNHSAA
jgi:hypothetical protein